MQKEVNLSIKLAQLSTKLSEVIKYSEKRGDYYEQEIKSLHRENAKQSEEIRDCMYLVDSLRVKLDQFDKLFSEKKTESFECKKLNQEKFNVLDEELQKKFNQLNELIEKYSNKKLITLINTIATFIVSMVGLIGLLSGYIKVGN